MEKSTRAATTRDSEKYIVRFPDGMRDRIADSAKANNRSMNAEIIARLETTFASQRELFSESELREILVSLQGDVKAIKTNMTASKNPTKK